MNGVWAARRAAAFAAMALAVSCGGANEERRRPAEPALQIWAPIVVRWEPGRPRHLDFAIENPTSRTVGMAAPDPANARVELYGPESVRLCSFSPGGRAAPGTRVALAPGDRVTVRVDLDAACGAVPPGEYRYEVSYRSPDPAGPFAPASAPTGASTFTGTIPVRYGRVIVAAPGAGAACEPTTTARGERARLGRPRSRTAGPGGDA